MVGGLQKRKFPAEHGLNFSFGLVEMILSGAQIELMSRSIFGRKWNQIHDSLDFVAPAFGGKMNPILIM